MRSFIGAILLFCLVSAFVIVNMFTLCSALDEMIELGEGLPKTAEELDLSDKETAEAIQALYRTWDESVQRLTVTMGYDSIDRADDAIVEAYQSFQNEDKEGFTVALAKAIDALSRMRRLESFHRHCFF